MEISTCLKELAQSPQMKLIWKDLNDTFHEIFLSYGISATHSLFKYPWKDIL